MMRIASRDLTPCVGITWKHKCSEKCMHTAGKEPNIKVHVTLGSSPVHSARVAFYKIEQQFKTRNIPYNTVACTNVAQTPELAHLQSGLSRSVPLLCVQSSDILSGAPAAEAAMPNIRVISLNWWDDEKQAQVRLSRYMQCGSGSDARCPRWSHV